jgi:cell division septum initiation protein DivIVA
MRRILPVLAAALLLPLAALSQEQPVPPKGDEPAKEPPGHPSASEAIDKAKDHADAAIAESKDASGKAMDKGTEATRILDKAAQAAREVLDKAKTATSEVLDKAKEATKDMGSKGKPEDDKPIKPPPPDSL